MDMMDVFVQGEAHMHTLELNEHRVPMPVIQKAAQGEVHDRTNRGQVYIALKRKNKTWS